MNVTIPSMHVILTKYVHVYVHGYLILYWVNITFISL